MDARAARRLLAIAHVLDGQSRSAAAESCGMDRPTLRGWVHRYKADGLVGLHNRPGRPGSKPRLSPEHLAEVATWAEQGPTQTEHGVVRWRCVDLCDAIAGRFGVTLHEGTVGKQLRRLDLRRLPVRPQHPESDPAAREAYKKLRHPAERRPAGARAGQAHRYLVPERNAVGQQGIITRIWARRGSRPRAPKDRRFAWAWLFGAVCPARGTSAGLVLPHVNTAAMTLHLAEISRTAMPDAHAVIVVDGAGWHQGQQAPRARKPHPAPAAALCARVEPVENIWDCLRSNRLSNASWQSYDEIVRACPTAWNWLTRTPEIITSIATRDWAIQVSK